MIRKKTGFLRLNGLIDIQVRLILKIRPRYMFFRFMNNKYKERILQTFIQIDQSTYKENKTLSEKSQEEYFNLMKIEKTKRAQDR